MGMSGPRPTPPDAKTVPADLERGRFGGRSWMLAAAIAVVCIIVAVTYWPALSAKAYSFDDGQYLRDNPLVRNPSWTSVDRFLSEVREPSTVSGYYQPLTMISLMVDYELGGRPENPRQFHRTSLLLHIINVALIICLLYLLFGNVWAAAAVGLLFGVHPMTVEPIPWVSERKTLLASLFALACLVLYVRYVRRPRWWLLVASLLLFILSLMSKPTSTPLAAGLLLLDYWPLRRLSWRSVAEKIPFFIVAGVSAKITVVSQRAAAGLLEEDKSELLRPVLVVCHNIVFYLYSMIWPVRLSWRYPFPEPFDLSQPMVLAGVIGTAVLCLAALIAWRWTRAPLVCGLFCFVVILPTMGIIGFTNVIAAHKFAYLPAVGVLMLLAPVAKWAWANPSRAWRIASVTVVVVLAALEIVSTRRHLAPWQDTERLHRYMLDVRPNAAMARYNLANYLAGQGRIDDAIVEYAEVVRQMPQHWKAHSNLSNALLLKHRYVEALVYADEALRLKPDSAPTHLNRGLILLHLNRPAEAAEAFRRTLELDPNNTRARQQLDALRRSPSGPGQP